jgi:hypothetical protein
VFPCPLLIRERELEFLQESLGFLIGLRVVQTMMSMPQICSIWS